VTLCSEMSLGLCVHTSVHFIFFMFIGSELVRRMFAYGYSVLEEKFISIYRVLGDRTIV
jgi:hypothetical protein